MSYLIKQPDIHVKQFKAHEFAQFSYAIESEKEVAIIDPIRDTTQYLSFAQEFKAHIKYSVLTHIHADFVAGHHELAKKCHAKTVFGPGVEPEFEAKIVNNKDSFKVGNHFLKALHTPGHTLESTCWVLEDAKHTPMAVFTGDTLFVGDVGRADLAQNGTHSEKDLARNLFKSLKSLKELPDDLKFYPGHGSGSACGKGIALGDYSTLGAQKSAEVNPAFAEEDEHAFIENVTQNVPTPPAYFAHSIHHNKSQAIPLIDELIHHGEHPLSAEKFKESISASSATVLDCRSAQDFEKEHIQGSVFVPLDGVFAIWATYALDFKNPGKVLLVCPPNREHEAIHRLALVGVECISGYLQGGFDSWKEAGFETVSLKTEKFNSLEEFNTKTHNARLIDIRNHSEWSHTGVFPKAILTSLPNLRAAALAAEDKETPIYVHCKAGIRGLVGTSLLQHLGFKDAHNVVGGFDAVVSSGVTAEKFEGKTESLKI